MRGALLGVLRVAFVGFADENAVPAAAGLALAAFGAGSFAGGVIYGSRNWPGTAGDRIALVLAGYTLGVGLLALAPNLPVLLVLCVLAGCFLAPEVIITFELVGTCARPGHRTESYAWGITATFSGAALGNAAGGAIAESASSTAIAVAAGFGALATVTALLRRRTLQPAPAPA